MGRMKRGLGSSQGRSIVSLDRVLRWTFSTLVAAVAVGVDLVVVVLLLALVESGAAWRLQGVCVQV